MACTSYLPPRGGVGRRGGQRGGETESTLIVDENHFRGGVCPRFEGEDRGGECGVRGKIIGKEIGCVQASLETEPSFDSEDPLFLSDYIIRVSRLPKLATFVNGRPPRSTVGLVDGARGKISGRCA